MRAREFVTEQRELPDETKDPMRWTFVLPGLSAADPYRNYRFGVALARARSDAMPDDVNPDRPEWSAETAFGEHGVVSGMNSGIATIIDQALTMTNTPGGKRLVSTPDSVEPDFVSVTSPLRPFSGYGK